MKINEVKELLDKYYAGDSTREEELNLLEYFDQEVIDTELESYASEFRFFTEAARQKLDDQFEDDLLYRLSNQENGKDRFINSTLLRVAAAILLLAVGYFSRELIPAKDLSAVDEISALREEMGEMREILVLNLLEQGSTHDQLKGINMANNLNTMSAEITLKLLELLNDEVNVNLKLALLELLVSRVDEEEVVQGLIDALDSEQSTLVQLEIIQIMVLLKEKKVIPELERLLQKEDLNDDFREDIKRSIQLINKEI